MCEYLYRFINIFKTLQNATKLTKLNQINRLTVKKSVEEERMMPFDCAQGDKMEGVDSCCYK